MGILNFFMEPEYSYVICSYCTNKEIEGGFGACIFQEKGEPVKCVTAKPWKTHTRIDGEWKGATAAGSAMPAAGNNPNFLLTVDKGESDAYIMVQQKTKDVSAIVFIENRIMPTKFYIGLHVIDEKSKNYCTKRNLA